MRGERKLLSWLQRDMVMQTLVKINGAVNGRTIKQMQNTYVHSQNEACCENPLQQLASPGMLLPLRGHAKENPLTVHPHHTWCPAASFLRALRWAQPQTFLERLGALPLRQFAGFNKLLLT